MEVEVDGRPSCAADAVAHVVSRPPQVGVNEIVVRPAASAR
ncbi:hypothetical protein [Streptomyces sp. YKOK-I1]